MQKACFKGSAEGNRPFDQAGDFVQQGVRHQSDCINFGGQMLHLLVDHCLALIKIRQHISGAQLLEIVARVADRDRLWRVETMAVADVARCKILNRRGDDLIILHQHHPLHRTHKLSTTGGRAHPLGNR